jgi:hypothetical protein
VLINSQQVLSNTYLTKPLPHILLTVKLRFISKLADLLCGIKCGTLVFTTVQQPPGLSQLKSECFLPDGREQLPTFSEGIEVAQRVRSNVTVDERATVTAPLQRLDDLIRSDSRYQQYQRDRETNTVEPRAVTEQSLPSPETFSQEVSTTNERLTTLTRAVQSIESEYHDTENLREKELLKLLSEVQNSLIMLDWGLDDLSRMYSGATGQEQVRLAADLTLLDRALSAQMRQLESAIQSFHAGEDTVSSRTRLEQMRLRAESADNITVDGTRFNLGDYRDTEGRGEQALRLATTMNELLAAMPAEMRDVLEAQRERLLIIIDDGVLTESERRLATNAVVPTDPVQYAVAFNPERLARFSNTEIRETLANELWDVYGKMRESSNDSISKGITSTVKYQCLGIVFDAVMSAGPLSRDEMARAFASVMAAYVAQKGEIRGNYSEAEQADLDNLTRLATGGVYSSIEELWDAAIPYYHGSL